MNIAPGEFIREELELRNWRQDDLVEVRKKCQAKLFFVLNFFIHPLGPRNIRKSF
jgi:hypothetical protein